MPAKINIPIGTRFGKLVVIKFAGNAIRTNGKKGHRLYECRCDCGKQTSIRAATLTCGDAKSCGCFRPKHGLSKVPEYRTWMHMRERCYTTTTKQFEDYGGRGITVCERWRHSFPAFYADMGPRPSSEYTLERKNNDGNYDPTNCIWATRTTQQRNRRRTRWIEFQKERLTAGDLEERTGIPRKLIAKRVFDCGWEIERALQVPRRR